MLQAVTSVTRRELVFRKPTQIYHCLTGSVPECDTIHYPNRNMIFALAAWSGMMVE
jgi:hypothetical protein